MAKVSTIGITPTTRDVAQTGAGAAIITSGSGNWTAAVSDSWITLNSTSGAAGYPVAYTVSANPDVEDRVGYVYVAGYTHTITQKGLGCTVNKTNVEVERDGGKGTVTITPTDTRSGWKARPNCDWISVSPTSGTGSGTVTYQVAPWYEVSTRSGTITVGGKTITIFQYGSRMDLDSYSASCDYYTYVIPITVNALAITSWTVTPNASWISVVDGGNGKGGDLVSIAVGENSSYKARTGTVTIGTETFTVTQAGRTALAFSVSPATTTADVSGANGLASVTATPDLPWTVSCNANWITVLPNFKSGAGNGNVVYTVSPQNTLYSRTGTITVTPEAESKMAAKTHKVTQPAATSAVSLSGYEFAASGESVAIEVTVNDIVEWKVEESIDWLTVQGATSRVGPGTVTLVAAANDSVYPRSGTLKIAEKTVKVSQKARGVEVEYDNKLFGTDGGMESISIHPDGKVAWTAVSSDPTWIVIYQNDSGTGDAEIMYIIAPYTGDGSPRVGWIDVGDKRVYITQRAYDLDISPRGDWVSGNAGAGEIAVSAGIKDVWSAIVTEPWITIVTGYDAGTGNGTVRFAYTDNETGKTRVGKIIVAGEAYTLTQAARIMVPITTAVEGGGRVTGGGSYALGSKVSLEAVANDGYEFLYWSGDAGETMQNPIEVTADVAKSVTAHFAPLRPTFVSAESSTEGVKLTWTNLAWANSYKIYRAPTNEFPTKEIATVEATGSCVYVDTTGEAGVSYFYWVEAIGATDCTETKDAATGMKQKPIVYSSITYTNLKGATHTNPTTYQEGTTVSFSAPSAVTGYTFTGWTPSAITADMKGAQAVMANWKANTYTIAYNANGGSGTMAGTAATYDQNATLAACAFMRTGFEFVGWATDAAGSVAYAAGGTVRNLSALQGGVVTLYAVWEALPPPPADTEDPLTGGAGEAKIGGIETDNVAGWTVVERGDAKFGSACLRGTMTEVYDEVGDSTYYSAKIKGAGTLSFWWKPSCEADPAGEYTWDHAEFWVDDQLVAQVDGELDWQEVSVDITGDGDHVIMWMYVTDGYAPEVEGLEECVLIDGLSWTGEAYVLEPLANPVISPADGSTFMTETCAVTITCETSDAIIYYSTNGRTPSTTETARYKGSFEISKTTTVKAVAVRGSEKSEYVSATITKVEPRLEDVTVGKDVTGREEPVTVSASWVTETLVARYGAGKADAFKSQFGLNLAAALAKPTGKVDVNGKAMTVWDDYVAGTDPTDPTSVFKAVIEIVDGKVRVSWEPNLNDGTAVRFYKLWGRKSLGADEWHHPAKDGDIFFKVEVDLPTGEESDAPSQFDSRYLGGVQLWEGGPYWAECNVGAEKPEDYGYYFWWGDTVGYAYDGSKWNAVDGSSSDFEFQHTNPTIATSLKDDYQLEHEGWIDTSGNLVATHDAATAHLGAPWRMPTAAEFAALISNCDTQWTVQNGVYGRLVKGRGAFAAKSIFLPAAGVGHDTKFFCVGVDGEYWSSTQNSDCSIDAWSWELSIALSVIYRSDSGNRYEGYSIRPVRGFAK